MFKPKKLCAGLEKIFNEQLFVMAQLVRKIIQIIVIIKIFINAINQGLIYIRQNLAQQYQKVRGSLEREFLSTLAELRGL